MATTEELVGLARGRLAEGGRFDVRLPYGPMDWTILVLHVLWDSWIHERDVLLARGAEHPTDGDATGYAAAYGIFISAAVASMFGDQVREKLSLGGDGGGLLGALPASSRTALSHLADFFNTPVEQSPA